jgi:hypothetical protein
MLSAWWFDHFRCVSAKRCLFFLLALCFFALDICPPAQASSPLGTSTALTVAPTGPFAFSTVATMKATVLDSNNGPVTAGTVTFYDGKSVVGSAQIVNNGNAFAHGTATVKKIFCRRIPR